MPVVLLQPGVSLTLVDDGGSTSRFEIPVRSGASAVQGRESIAALRSLLPSSCTPIAARLTYTADEQAPAAGAGDSSRCAVLVFETTAADQLAVIAVPGLRPGLVDPADPRLVHRTAAPVLALIAALQTGIWCNPFGYSLTNCIAALVENKP